MPLVHKSCCIFWGRWLPQDKLKHIGHFGFFAGDEVHRQNTIFGSLILVVSIAIMAAGYVTGRGPLGVISNGILRLTAGDQMIPSGKVTEETKAPTAPELSSGT